jgi:hypothetical protein
LVAGIATIAAASLTGVGMASASTTNGIATIASSNGGTPLTSGGSTTAFTVTLPANAACTGDTATGGYHVYSYLVQQGTNIAALNFSSGTPSSGYGLVDASGYWGAQNTAAVTGQIIGIPTDFQWQYLSAELGGASALLYSGGTTGVWEAGIACANSSGALTDNWNVPVTFTSSSGDPHGFVFSTGVSSSAPEVPYTLAIPVLAAGIIAVAVAIRRRKTAADRVMHSTTVG